MVILHVIFRFSSEIDFSRHENLRKFQVVTLDLGTRDLPWIPRWFRGAPSIKASCSAWPKCRAEFILPAMTPPEWGPWLAEFKKKTRKWRKWPVKLDEAHGWSTDFVFKLIMLEKSTPKGWIIILLTVKEASVHQIGSDLTSSGDCG